MHIYIYTCTHRHRHACICTQTLVHRCINTNTCSWLKIKLSFGTSHRIKDRALSLCLGFLSWQKMEFWVHQQLREAGSSLQTVFYLAHSVLWNNSFCCQRLKIGRFCIEIPICSLSWRYAFATWQNQQEMRNSLPFSELCSAVCQRPHLSLSSPWQWGLASVPWYLHYYFSYSSQENDISLVPSPPA